MNVEEIEVLIEYLPIIFIYFVPGYIFIRINCYRFTKDINKINNLLLKSVVVSYILIALVKFIFQICSKDFNLANTLVKIILIFVSIIAGMFCSKILLNKYSKNILEKLGLKKSFNPNIFDDITDEENGTWIVVYMPEERVIYKGVLQRYEDKEELENYFLILSNYILYDYKQHIIEDNLFVSNKWVMLNTKDISRIEILYSENSYKIEKSCIERNVDDENKKETVESS